MAQNKCGTCIHFLGGGDWNLCCDLPHDGYPCGFLCYADTDACESYEEVEHMTKGEALEELKYQYKRVNNPTYRYWKETLAFAIEALEKEINEEGWE